MVTCDRYEYNITLVIPSWSFRMSIMEHGDLLLKGHAQYWYGVVSVAVQALLCQFVITVLPCPFCLAPPGAGAKQRIIDFQPFSFVMV